MDSTWQKKVSKCFLIPQRYVMGIMGCLAIFSNYDMRVVLNIAITEMVAHKSETSNYEYCPAPNKASVDAVNNSDILYDWDEETQGLILSSFFWGYIVTHVPGGVLAERFGGKYVLGVGVLVNAVLALLTPLIITSSSGNFGVVVALRVVEGLGQGTTYPAINSILGQWVPKKEISTIASLTYAGSQLGTIVTNSVSGTLIHATKNWAYVFYLFGCVGIIWCIAWQLLCYSYPDTHPFISENEKEYLQKELSSHVRHEKRKIPWRQILTSVPVWACINVQVGNDWGFFIMVTDLPKYMKDVLRFNIQENGIYSAVPHALMLISAVISGYVCDWVINKNYISTIAARKLFTSFASIGAGVFMVIASYSGCNRLIAVVMFSIAMCLMGLFYCGSKVNCLDLSPNFGGTLMALSNGLGVITGIISPYIAGYLTPNRSVHEWRHVFWVAFGMFVVTTIIFLIFGTAEEQPWNQIEQQTEDKDQV